MCSPRVERIFPVTIGDIPPSSQASVKIPVNFSSCGNDARFAVGTISSASNGAVVSAITANDQPE
jgi:hypothetical protein